MITFIFCKEGISLAWRKENKIRNTKYSLKIHLHWVDLFKLQINTVNNFLLAQHPLTMTVLRSSGQWNVQSAKFSGNNFYVFIYLQKILNIVIIFSLSCESSTAGSFVSQEKKWSHISFLVYNKRSLRMLKSVELKPVLTATKTVHICAIDQLQQKLVIVLSLSTPKRQHQRQCHSQPQGGVIHCTVLIY